jgi:hypothetical protein
MKINLQVHLDIKCSIVLSQVDLKNSAWVDTFFCD